MTKIIGSTPNTNSRLNTEVAVPLKYLSNNSDYLIDLTFRNINRLLVLSFKNGDADPTRNYFDEYYMPLVEIKDFNELIDNRPFFDQPIKNKQEAYEKTC